MKRRREGGREEEGKIKAGSREGEETDVKCGERRKGERGRGRRKRKRGRLVT